MKRAFLLVLLIFIAFLSFAQQKLTVKMPLADTSKYVQLAHYYGYKQFFKVDSAKVNKNGLLEFSSKAEPWKGGVYLLVTSPSKFYDLVISGSENNIYMEFDTTDYTKTVNFKNSPENVQLFSYRKYLNEEMKEAEKIKKQISSSNDPAKKTTLNKELRVLQKEVNTELQKRVKLHPNFFASKIMLANLEPELPETPPILPNGRPDSTYNYRFYKAHFFDNLDFTDERMIRTPFLESKLERYFDQLVFQRTDTLKKETDFVLAKTKKNQEVYRYVLWYITNKYENTNVVGLDGTVVHLYENHYLKDANWLDDETRQKFKNRVEIMKPIETGKVMPALVLKDTLGRAHDLYDVKAKYTIVNFYSPNCGHCKDQAPILSKFQEDNRSKGFVVWDVAADPDRDEKEWRGFIKTYKTSNLTNLFDPDKKYDFYSRYDVYSTPTLYILDENKRIVAKRIAVEDVLNFIDFYEKNMATR